MSLEKAIIRLVKEAHQEAANQILAAIFESREKSTNSFHNLTTKINKLTMSQKSDFQAVLGRLDAATNAEAQKLKDLQDKVLAAIANGGMTVEEENEIKAEFEAKIAFLEGLGKAENPVPEPTPQPTPTEPAPAEEPAPTTGETGEVTPQ